MYILIILYRNMNVNKTKLMIGTILIHRVLIGKLLLNPSDTVSREVTGESIR